MACARKHTALEPDIGASGVARSAPSPCAARLVSHAITMHCTNVGAVHVAKHRHNMDDLHCCVHSTHIRGCVLAGNGCPRPNRVAWVIYQGAASSR